MDLKWLEDFVALARIGSFSHAASQRHITQPAFSRRIRSLEGWIGATLIDRECNPVKLTAAGKEFLPHALNIIAETESVKQDFRLLYRIGDSAIRIITSHRLSVHTVPKLIVGFLRANPDVHVSVMPQMVSTESYGDYAQALITGIADFLITYDHKSLIINEDLSGRLECLEIGKETIAPVTSPAYADTIGESWCTDPSAKINYIGYPDYSFTGKAIYPIVKRFEKQFHKLYESPFTGSIRAMLLEGIGMTWLPLSVVGEDLDSGRLVRLKGEQLCVEISVMIYRRKESTGLVMERFWREVGTSTAKNVASIAEFKRPLSK